jgi:uncharacterized membrane protein HdeD (DUF308 family)
MRLAGGQRRVRQRYYLLVSVVYIALGVVIVVRSAVAHVLVVGILGVVLIALGLVRLRDLSARNRLS